MVEIGRKDRALLFDKLEQFVNMGDDRRDIEAFIRYASGFLPHRYRYLTKPDLDGDLEFNPAVLIAMRTDLRNVWEGKDLKGLGLSRLLGISTGEPWDEIAKGMDPAKESVVRLYHNAHFDLSGIVPNWDTGGFDYTARFQFHEAVYALMRESWRAKVCGRRECKRYFIADESRQRYCSTGCFIAVRCSLQRQYWKRKGSMRRKERSAKRRGKRGK